MRRALMAPAGSTGGSNRHAFSGIVSVTPAPAQRAGDDWLRNGSHTTTRRSLDPTGCANRSSARQDAPLNSTVFTTAVESAQAIPVQTSTAGVVDQTPRGCHRGCPKRWGTPATTPPERPDHRAAGSRSNRSQASPRSGDAVRPQDRAMDRVEDVRPAFVHTSDTVRLCLFRRGGGRSFGELSGHGGIPSNFGLWLTGSSDLRV